MPGGRCLSFDLTGTLSRSSVWVIPSNNPYGQPVCRLLISWFLALKSDYVNSCLFSTAAMLVNHGVPESTFLWRKGFSNLAPLSVFALVFLFSCSCIKSSIVPSKRATLGTSSSRHFGSTRACCLHCEVRVSDWTNDVLSRSFAFPIAWMWISYEFY